ncbi:P63C domain-containing protein [Cellulomonas iranensis]|uniref:P63C domain-containing protein n=1 Tax=Cellulomonas iranensis TaxID=76862 RepID=UPI0013D80F11|nr:P63C domain-containing protein [Cellulomonas iranensis]
MKKQTTVEDATDAALFRLGASEGGRARARKLTPEERSEIARRAAEARWSDSSDLMRARYTGALVIGEIELECAVLDDGTRLIAQGTMLTALGRAKSMGRRGDAAPFVSASNLQEFIAPGLQEQLEPITYKIPGQRFAGTGYRAEALPAVCDVYLAARRANALLPSQMATADAAETLIRSLAKVGIIALVDEATGYQAERARDELQRLVEKFVSEDFRPWVRVFPDAFFSEIYRLYGWEYKPGQTKHPNYVGKFINGYIYQQLPEGVADELRRVNPRRPSGWRARKHHQHLTVDTGNIALDRQIMTITTLMQVSQDLDEFKTLFARKFPGEAGRKVLRVVVDEHDEVQTLFELEAPPQPA